MNICTKIKSNLLLLNDDRRILDYVCPKCDNILGDPAKTSCGHWLCKGCAEELVKRNAACCVCETDLVDGDGEIQFTPDKFLREEICSLFIKCPNNKFGCGWVDTIGALSEHVSCCMHRKQECPHCNEDFAMTEYQPHVDECPKMMVTCPLKDHGCKETNEMTKEECINHVSSKDGLFDHVVMMVAALSSLPTNPLKPESLESFAIEDGVRGAIESFVTIIAELIAEITKKDSQIRILEDKVAQLETITMSFCYGNFDGSMVWKIPQFSQRMDDARTGKYTSIFSLPFSSSRNGYKMCLRLYILGDGIGKGTHMSLFFVVMKGEYDALLQWPFTHKVTFKLINQCGKRDAVQAFQPDPLSSSFQKPKSDMNVASGCPRFVSKNELMEGGFIVDDTIFIKVKVDTAT